MTKKQLLDIFLGGLVVAATPFILYKLLILIML